MQQPIYNASKTTNKKECKQSSFTFFFDFNIDFR